ncbi:VCBS repeat-containing protein [Candidatus Desantisbacteria bacterium]|nr:VCBS repeat-containing protein [Candidatus Desantisbacteria bacterium]
MKLTKYVVPVIFLANLCYAGVTPPSEIKITPTGGDELSCFNISWKGQGTDTKGYYYKLDNQPNFNWTKQSPIKIRVSYPGNHKFYLSTIDKNNDISPFVISQFFHKSASPSIGTASFSLSEPVLYDTGGSPGIIAAGDVNGDGLNDVVSANYYDNNISVFIQQKDGTLATQATYTVGQGPFGVGIGDLNSDGKNEVVVGCAAADQLYVFSQNDGGTLTQTDVYSTGRGPYGLMVGDINSDGRNDIVVTNSGGQSISILTWLKESPETYQYLFGSLQKANSLTMQRLNNGEIFAHLLYPAGATPFWLCIGDINGDEMHDITCVNYSDNTISLYLQQPDRSMVLVGNLAVPAGNPPNVCLGDINGDGLNELAVSGGGPISVFGRKDNSIGLIGTYTATEGSNGGVRIGDVNNDGRQDLVSTHAKNISVFLQDGNGKLLKPIAYYAGDCPGGLAIADVDNDGINEIITGNIRGNSISVLHVKSDKVQK